MTVTDEMLWAGYQADAGVEQTIEAFKALCPVWIADMTAIYLAMRALDPEVAELRRDIQELRRVLEVADEEIRNLTAALHFQGYARGEDGAWERPNPTLDEVAADQIDQLQRHVAQRDKELAVSQAIRADLLCVLKVVNDRCLRLVALRPVVKAVVKAAEMLAGIGGGDPVVIELSRDATKRLNDSLSPLLKAVRALPPEWRG